MKITVEWLLAHGAEPNCADLARFAGEWRDGVDITAESLARARAIGLDPAWLALCADLTPEVVERLALDHDVYVRRALAEGRATLTPEVVERLAGDHDEWVRTALAVGRRSQTT